MTRPHPARKAKWSPHLRTLRRVKSFGQSHFSPVSLLLYLISLTLDNLGLMDAPPHTHTQLFLTDISYPDSSFPELSSITKEDGYYICSLVPSVLPSFFSSHFCQEKGQTLIAVPFCDHREMSSVKASHH